MAGENGSDSDGMTPGDSAARPQRRATYRLQLRAEFDFAAAAAQADGRRSFSMVSDAAAATPATSVGCVLLIPAVVGRARKRVSVTMQLFGFVMSEDRACWWDGSSWHDAAKEIPPRALRSQSGRWWSDGKDWRQQG